MVTTLIITAVIAPFLLLLLIFFWVRRSKKSEPQWKPTYYREPPLGVFPRVREVEPLNASRGRSRREYNEYNESSTYVPPYRPDEFEPASYIPLSDTSISEVVSAFADDTPSVSSSSEGFGGGGDFGGGGAGGDWGGSDSSSDCGSSSE